jgi:Ser/Thr protein kinase RdoA (MazF antagonist)
MEIGNEFDIAPVLRAWALEPGLCEIQAYGSGHINSTFKVSAPEEIFLLQRINHHIFKDVEKLMANFSLTTRFILNNAPTDEPYPTIRLISTSSGAGFFRSADGNYWRAMHLLPGSYTIDTARNTGEAYESGSVLGRFYRMLQNFKSEELFMTLPAFHSLGGRYRQFESALAQADFERISMAHEWIEISNKLHATLQPLGDKIDSGYFPLRVVHNDPKINNILFDSRGKGLCMIDLDTVMPGCLLHDFGDAIRTTASLSAEDEADISLVNVSIPLFEAYTRGFTGQFGNYLSDAEKKHLHKTPALMAFIIGLRFLTDFLNNDVYYRVHHPGHNLQRAAAQLTLASKMGESEDAFARIIQSTIQAGQGS